MAYTTATVNAWYQAVQFQNGPTATVNTWVAGLNAGTITPAQVQNSIITQDTYTLGVVNPVLRLYQAAFASVPDQPGQAYWVGQFGTGAQTYQQIANGFANSSQFKTAYGTTGATQAASSAVVTTMYYNILLRAPDAGGLAYWTGKAIGDVLAGISTSPEMINDMSVPITNYQSAEIAGNAATSGSMYQYPGFPTTNYVLTTGVDAPGTGAFAGSVGVSVGSNSTVFGTWNGASGNTFTPGDQITAASGASNTVLNLSDAGTGGTGNVNSVAATVSNMTSLVANSGETLVANTTGWTGLTSITATSASVAGLAAAAPTTITAASTTNVTVTDTAASIAAPAATGAGVTIAGGRNVSVTERGSTATASTITVGGSSSTNPSGTVNVTVSGVSTSAPGTTIVSINGGTSVTVAQGQTGAVTIGNTTAPTGAVSVTTNISQRGTAAANSTAGAITIGGGASASVSETSLIGNTVAISGVTGANTVTMNSISVGATSAVTINGGTTATVNTTGGNVSIGGTTLSSGAVSVINTNSRGAGSGALNADTIAVDGQAAVAAGAVSVTTKATSGNITVGNNAANLGVNNTVSVSNSTTTSSGGVFYGSSATTISVAGGTSVTQTGGGATTIADNLATNALTTVTLNNVLGAVTLGSTALNTLNITNSGLFNSANNTLYDPNGVAQTATTVGLTSAANGTIGVNLNGTQTGTALTANNAKVVNVTVAGSGSSFLALTQTLTPAATGKSLSVTNNGTGTFTLTALTNTNVGTGYTVSTAGSGSIALGNLSGSAFGGVATTLTGTAPTSVTSTGTGPLSVTIDGTATAFTGGSSVNTVSLIGAGGGLTKVINGGTSGNNTLILDEVFTNYTAGPGLGISNFQNVTLATGATGNYSLAAFTGTAANNQTGAAVAFTNAASGQGLNIRNAAVGASSGAGAVTAITVATATGGGTNTVVINGKTVTFTVVNGDTATTATNLITAVNAAGIPGVYATSPGASQATILGATVLGSFAAGTGAATYSQGGAASQTLALGASNMTVGVSLATITGANTLPISIGDATTTNAGVAAINEANYGTLQVTAVQALGSTTQTLNILDTTTTAQANGATSISVAGAGKLNIGYNVNTATGTNQLTTLNAATSSGTLNATGVVFATTGANITGGSGALTSFGSGVLANNNGTGYLNAVDIITLGAGGGTTYLGYGGAGGGTGSTTLNMSASIAKADTVAVAPSTAAVRATVSGFTTGVNNSDVLRFTTATQTNTNGQFSFATAQGQTILTTIATAQSTAGFGGTDTYTISNGMIVFSGGDTLAQKLTSAKNIVNAAGANSIGAFALNGSTYVIGSGLTNTVGNDDIQLTMSGLSATQIGGATGAANAVIFDTATSTASTYTGATKAVTNVAATTTDATGYYVIGVSGAGTATQTINNIGQSAIINDTSTGNYNLTTTQVGAAGANSMTLNMATNAHTIPTLTVTGDSALTINSTVAGSIVTSLVDTGNTLATLNLGGTQSLRLDGVTDTALTTVNILNTGTTAFGLQASPISQNGLNVKVGSSTVDPGAATVYVSGANDIISVLNATDNSTHTLSATGAGSTVNAGIGATTVIVGANGIVNFLNTTPATAGVAAVTGNSAANTVTVGANSVVNFAIDTATGAALGGGSTVFVTGDTAGSSLTNLTTINNITNNAVVANATKIDFSTNAVAADVSTGGVNTAGSATLADALNTLAYNIQLAENGAAVAGQWFAGYTRFGGDTYIVASLDDGITNTGLVAADIVVKITGLPNLTNFATSGAADSAIAL